MSDENKEVKDESLNKTISDAAEKEKEKIEGKEEKEEKPPKKEKEDPEEDDDEQEGSGDDEEDEKARQLYKALSNPATARQVIEVMARNAGIIDTPKKEEKVVKTITDVIKDELGTEYSFLSSKLGKIIPQVVERIVEEKTEARINEIKEKQMTREKEEVSKEFHSAFEKLSEEFEDFDDLQGKMNKLMDVHPVTNKQTAYEYFRDLYYIAKSSRTTKSKVVVDKAKLQKSKENVGARLSAEGEPKDTSKGSSGNMTLRQSIQAAIDEIQEKGT